MTNDIVMKHVVKSFTIPAPPTERSKNALSFLKKDTRLFTAINEMNLTVQKGDILGYIGANGAGKSTTIKMLTGVLVPTSGEISVLGQDPFVARKENAKKIGVVFGQRSQLIWELPPIDSFELFSRIYNIPTKEKTKRIQFFIDYMDIGGFINTPVRKLSLGQRMCCEVVCALLHEPEILFLDEPTIGLDLLNKEKIRKLILKMNKEKQTTVLLTTHDLSDIAALCNRVAIIHNGEKIYDDYLESLIETYDQYHTLCINGAIKNEVPIQLPSEWECNISAQRDRMEIRFLKNQFSTVDIIGEVTKYFHRIDDLSIEKTSMEDIIKEIYINPESI